MTSCPDLGVLEARPRAGTLDAHLVGCEACRLVADALDDFAADGRAPDACERFDALLAAREDGALGPAGENLLARHLASCTACREVAASISPAADADGDHLDLPSVDPASYALGLEVARGGMGRILAARDLRVGRPVAVKELLGNSPQLAARFEREARVTARLQHPGIVPIYEIGRWPDGTPFYTMRMVDGTTLREAIERAPSPAARLGLLPQVLAAAEAVAFAHGQRVIHRDLTPSNVLLGAYGETVVIDWGLAKSLSDAPDSDDVADDPYRSTASSASLTSAGAVIGTAAYMPPEQAHAVPVDERADVYALGAILYHVLAGEAPYKAPTTRELLREVKAGPPTPILVLAPHAPRDLVSIVTKAMARDPNDRYPTARELSEELARFQTGRLVEAHAYSRGERVRRFIRKHRATVIASVLALGIIAAIGELALSRVLRSHAETSKQLTALLEERAQKELLDGSPMRGLAYLEAAFRRGADTPSLRFMLAGAMRDLDTTEVDLDCDRDVRWFALSPDGRDLAVVCYDTGRVYDLASGKLRASLGPFTAGFHEVIYAPDGRTLATWGRDGRARVWDAQTGAMLLSLDHGAALTVVSFSADGQRIATLGRDGVVIAWTADGTPLQRIVANRNPIARGVWGAITPDGERILTLTLFGDGAGWDIATGARLGGFDHGALVLGAELSRDGTRAATCGFDRLVKVWDTRTGALVRELGGHTDVPWKCVFSRDGSLLLTTGHDGRAVVWDLATGVQVANVLHEDAVTAADFSADGRRFVTVGIGGRVLVWDTRSGARLVSHDTLGGKHARFSIDGSRLVTERGDGRLRVWRRAGGPLEGGYTPGPGEHVAAILPDGARVVVEETGGELQLWNTRTHLRVPHVPLHGPVAVWGSSPSLLDLIPDPLVAATTDDAVVLLDAMSGAVRTRIERAGHGRPKAIALNRDVLVIVDAGGADVFDHSGALRVRVPAVTGVVLSGEGPRMVVSEASGALTLWDLTRGERITQLAVTSPATRVIGIGDAIMVLEGPAEEPRTPTLWDPNTGKKLGVLEKTRIPPTFDATGTYIATIGTDQVITIVRARTNTVVSSFAAQGILHAQVDPAGELVVGLGAHGAEMVVMSATDGWLLARWPIDHAPPTVSETSFRPAGGTAHWTPDGMQIVTSARSVGVWDAARKVPDAALLAKVRAQLPWHFENSTLVWVRGRITGRVLRGGDGDEPVAGRRVVATIRTPPELEGATISWESTRPRMREVSAETDEDGRYELRQLYPGEYRIEVEGVESSQRRTLVSVEEAKIDLSVP